ncbi:hypothetical protein LP419_27870 [Massilia sp. H-1]|nr:hypothetical protein LP419_27870 [Massilia sp. H-1]
MAPAHATLLPQQTYKPLITSGDLPDSPAARIDGNTSDSPYSGVVSLYIKRNGNGYICSGALVGKRSGRLSKPLRRRRRQRYPDRHQTARQQRASRVQQRWRLQRSHPRQQGIDGCLATKASAIARLALTRSASTMTWPSSPWNAMPRQAPRSTRSPPTNCWQAPASRWLDYGTSGDGANGFYIEPEFNIKRTGANYVDYFETDDEGVAGRNEVFIADFDGAGQDTHCTYFGICTPQLGNDVESGIGGGDSGGPSFVKMYGELMLVANNTFSTRYFASQVDGTFRYRLRRHRAEQLHRLPAARHHAAT